MGRESINDTVFRVGLVACCKAKRDFVTEAQDLYLSPLFRNARDIVEMDCWRWGILSAKHGLLMPGAVIAPYDLTLDGLKAQEKRLWARCVNEQLREWAEGLKASLFDVPNPRIHFVAFAGNDYAAALEGLSHDRPLAHLGIGNQLKALNQIYQALAAANGAGDVTK